MGLIKAALGAISGTLADQWREFFYCDSINENVLAVKGQKRTSSRSSNTKGSDNIISNGSVIAVNEGQCMMIVDQGKVVEFSAEPGEFTWDSSTESSIFYGNLGENILNTFKQVGRRITFGGDTGKDQRVYYFNTKEIIGNKYGTPSPVPFRVVDTNIGLDMDVAIRCHGEYSYKIVDPMLFYVNVCGNVSEPYTRDRIDSTLKSELLTALQPAFAKISEQGIRYSALPGHTTEIANALNEVLSKQWAELRGIEIASFGVSSVKASEEDEQIIKDLQRAAVMRNPGMGAAYSMTATADAMKAAASNTSAGPMMAFAGMNMAQNAGGTTAADLYQMQAAQQAQAAPKAPAQNEWTCECGAKNTGKFCTNCGKAKPAAEGEWVCECGTRNTGKFCTECGKAKPGKVEYKCSKCGWAPEDPSAPPKFCPNCGKPFGEEDIVK
ncbi:MAG: SPFH domain-containing protein [Christensenellaceae bacterium]|nr:SPFH domain-containing protein [Christensenellaceae bacterium]